MWTLKEAYTKALGLGLGFDFSRVEFDPENNIVRVDGQVPKGWWFGKFIVRDESDSYQGVVAEYVGGEKTVVAEVHDSAEWLKVQDAVSFTEMAIQKLENREI
ncbi:hypothetical protein AX16_000254 [Volvariella volvacea WC 439]|nr:hypothetical protein AX16_000254 [Volvariella volvacea WC 439]